MRTAVKTTDVYTFSELSESAKEKARAWYREGAFDCDWWDSVYMDAANIADLFGLDLRQTRKTRVNGTHFYDVSIVFRGFWSQGDGSAFTGRYSYKKGALAAVKKYAPQDTKLHAIVKRLQDIQRGVFYSATADIRRPTNCENTIRVNVECERLQYSESFLTLERELSDALEDFNGWIYSALKREYNWMNSDEQIDEGIQANEYEFTEIGERY